MSQSIIGGWILNFDLLILKLCFRWTQFIFLKLYQEGLVYQKELHGELGSCGPDCAGR